ncbi:RnfH family protein [Undibacterium seohonense]|jgi:putative ubiquitin-RnfH superfamily antitoxin RatB of RatAB toxin-antitoxin module|uniref:RnfH family protein n=1 Tax=Undibacterium seohonense TaxID=1344950 RepID=A0ABR6WZL1_9BURK|nr:RnfH family protein [Undibacterium seohonense]MBC3806087.1 RnfH family protein [Undibacterium seohonense]
MDHSLSRSKIPLTICYAPADVSPLLIVLEVAEHSSIAQVLASLPEPYFSEVKSQLLLQSACAIFGKKKNNDYIVSAGDRLEICRPLKADPMSARRRRAKREHKSGKM